jgi:toxin-antitoxin system PIN domain toxin
MFLPDVNLWLALAFEVHVHHLAARAWFEGEDDGAFGFCRMTQQGFLRLASNPRVFKEEAVSLARAWRLYDQIRSDPRVAFVHESADLETIWRSFTDRATFSPNLWNDAYLAALACAEDLVLMTFDKGFVQFPGLKCPVLQ